MKLKFVVLIGVVVTVIMLSIACNVYAVNPIGNYVVFNESSSVINNEFALNVEKNENVKEGKFAPGLKATMETFIDLSNLDFDVEVEVGLKEEVNECFEFNYKIDGKEYVPGTSFVVGKDECRVKTLDVEVVWKSGINNDYFIVNNYNQLVIPFNIKVKQILN